MAKVATEFKRNLLRGIKWDSEAQGVRLETALKTAVRARYSETNTGNYLIGATGNGASVSFALPVASSAYTPDAVASAVSELYDLYESAIAELSADGNDEPTDAQVFARMMALLKPVRSMGSDYSQLQTA